MRGSLHILAAVLFAIVSSSSSGHAQSSALAAIEAEQQKVFEAIAPSVVFVASSKGFGSGFFVTAQLALTNAHVVGNDKTVKIVMRGGKPTTGSVIAKDTDADLALIQVGRSGVPVRLAPASAVRVGSWVGAVGHGEGGVWSYTTGMVSNMYVKPGETTFIQTQIPINQGNSGGPVFNRSAEVVGLATAKNINAENLNFAVPIEVAIERFDALRKVCTCLRIEASSDSRVFVDGRLIGTGSMIVPATHGSHQVLVTTGSKSQAKTVEFPEQTTIEFK